MKLATLDAAQTLCGVTKSLDGIREGLGVQDREVFASMTMAEVQAAALRKAWCARHGGLPKARPVIPSWRVILRAIVGWM